MSACATGNPGAEPPGQALSGTPPTVEETERCPVCGSSDLADIRCKVICRNCRTIVQSCSDL